MALAASELAMYKNLFEVYPFGVVMALANGTICDANAAFCRLGGYIKESLLFRNIYEMLDSPEPGHTGEVPQLLNLSLSHAVEANFTHEQGHQVPILFSSSPFRTAEGDSYMWVFIEGMEERKATEAKRIQEEQLDVVGRMGDNIAKELQEHLDSLVNKLGQVLHHESDTLSSQGQQELHIVIQQTERLLGVVEQAQSRQRQELVSDWNVERTLAQVRLRLLRENNSSKLRRYLASHEGKQALTEQLHAAARRSSIDAGLEDLRQWLWNFRPPLVMFNERVVVWNKIQSVMTEAILELRDVMLQTMSEAQIPPIAMSSVDWDAVPNKEPIARHSPQPQRVVTKTPMPKVPSRPLQPAQKPVGHRSSSLPSFRPPQSQSPLDRLKRRPVPVDPTHPPAGFGANPTPPPVAPPVDTNRHVNVPSSTEVTLPVSMEQLVQQMLQVYDGVRLERWINRKSFEAYIRRHFDRHEDGESIELEPVWDILQKIPGMVPLIVKRYFEKLKSAHPTHPVEWPLFMQDSPYPTPPPV